MLWCDHTLARRIERAEAALMAGFAATAGGDERDGFTLPLAGGLAMYSGPGAPFNKVIGLGFDGPVEDSDVSAIERAYAERGAPVRAEVATCADNQVVRLLTRRGYQLVGFEHVLVRELSPDLAGATDRADESLAIAAALPEESRVWLQTILDGFAHPDDRPAGAATESFDRETVEDIMTGMLEIPGFQGYLARIGPAVAGAGSLRVYDGVAQLCGATTLPAFRRRGVQTGLLAARLAAGTAAGCNVAVITTEPASKSQQNAERQGFRTAYARAILVREPEDI